MDDRGGRNRRFPARAGGRGRQNQRGFRRAQRRRRSRPGEESVLRVIRNRRSVATNRRRGGPSEELRLGQGLDAFGDREGGGAQITQVMRDGVASGSGLQPGDVILEINGEKIADYSALAAKIREAGEGAPVNLRLRRGGSEFYQGLQLGARPK